jgi:hypothetical protein
MEILNSNQRSSALWRLSGLYATTVGIMGIIVFQSWKSYRSRVDAQHKQEVQALKAAIEQEKKKCDEAKIVDALKNATSSIIQNVKDIKQAQEKSPSNNSSVQGSLNAVNDNLTKAKAVQTTVKSIGTMATDLNPIKK